MTRTSTFYKLTDNGDEITIDCGDIYGAATMPIREPDFPADEQRANAAFIVTACNSHEALVVALERLTGASAIVSNLSHAGILDNDALSDLYESTLIAKAALDAARGESETL